MRARAEMASARYEQTTDALEPGNAAGGEFIAEFLESVEAAGGEQEAARARGDLAGEVGADAGGGAGDEDDAAVDGGGHGGA